MANRAGRRAAGRPRTAGAVAAGGGRVAGHPRLAPVDRRPRVRRHRWAWRLRDPDRQCRRRGRPTRRTGRTRPRAAWRRWACGGCGPLESPGDDVRDHRVTRRHPLRARLGNRVGVRRRAHRRTRRFRNRVRRPGAVRRRTPTWRGRTTRQRLRPRVLPSGTGRQQGVQVTRWAAGTGGPRGPTWGDSLSRLPLLSGTDAVRRSGSATVASRPPSTAPGVRPGVVLIGGRAPGRADVMTGCWSKGRLRQHLLRRSGDSGERADPTRREGQHDGQHTHAQQSDEHLRHDVSHPTRARCPHPPPDRVP